MKEDFLHYLWKYQLFHTVDICTTDKQPVQILTSGILNKNAGPDFFNAQLIIGEQRWAGNVEIHINASDWYVHHHEKDTNYDNVILHVVWIDDTTVFTTSNTVVPTLVLKEYIPTPLLINYQKLFSVKKQQLNCEKGIGTINSFVIKKWLERLYFERLQRKSEVIIELLKATNNDWEAVLFCLLTKNFGLKVNGDAFYNMAKQLDFSIVRKEVYRLEVLESLLFGQLGLLSKKIEGEYYQTLQKEYRYLTKKYRLSKVLRTQVQFFRLRPPNFPTIRLAQLSSLFHTHQNLFSKLMEKRVIEDFYKLFDIQPSEFWHTHYTFEKTSKHTKKGLTKSFIDLIIINTILPLKYVYQNHYNNFLEDDFIVFIQELPPEKNSTIDLFNTLGISSKDAMGSQALLELKNEYCNQQKCLSCAIGNELLKS